MTIAKPFCRPSRLAAALSSSLIVLLRLCAAQEVTPSTLRAIEHDIQKLLSDASVATVGIGADGTGGNGSGVIVTPSGYVLTVHHAAPKDDAIVTLQLGDGRTVKAKVMGGDKNADARILKIVEEGPWPYLPMANGKRLAAVGDWVIGLGHAGGIVADRPPQVRVGRLQGISGDRARTDCAMGPGDSGGPLLDRTGRVIGIHSNADARHTSHTLITVYQSAWDDWTSRSAAVASRDEAVSAFTALGGRVARSVVRLRAGGRPAALATVVSPDGLLISKSSEVHEPITVVGPDGQNVTATVVARSHVHDVVVLRVNPKGLGVSPVEWSQPKAALPGEFVAVAAPIAQPPLALGVVSASVRTIPDCAMMLGMELDELTKGPGVRIVRLIRGSVAANSDLRVDDIFTHVNKKPIDNRDDLFAELDRSGQQQVTITLKRDGIVANARFSLANPERHATDEQVSRRRNGFPACLQHDANVGPGDCGGPLIDLDARVVGINIARASHSATLAIPAEIVRRLVRELSAKDATR